MIEVLALAGAVTKIAGAVSSAVKAGGDVADLLPHFGKLAKLEADIGIAEQGRHKGPLGRLTSSEEEGFAIAQAKARDKLFWGISLTIGVILFLGGTGAMIWGLNEVVNG